MSTSTRVRLLRGSGLLLLLLGIVHLVATPHIAALIRRSVSQGAADNLIPPMLLNHILVGVLLLPLGFLTFYAAPYPDRWAQVIVRTTALTVATLPSDAACAHGRALLRRAALRRRFPPGRCRVGDVAVGCVYQTPQNRFRRGIQRDITVGRQLSLRHSRSESRLPQRGWCRVPELSATMKSKVVGLYPVKELGCIRL